MVFLKQRKYKSLQGQEMLTKTKQKKLQPSLSVFFLFPLIKSLKALSRIQPNCTSQCFMLPENKLSCFSVGLRNYKDLLLNSSDKII